MNQNTKFVPVIFVAVAIASFYYFKKTEISFVDGDSLILYGNVDIRDVALGFRVSGRIEKMHYEEGDKVEKNAVLATLEQDLLEDDYALAQAENDEALATLENAKRNYIRVSSLIKSASISRKEYEDALAKRDESIAHYATTVAKLNRTISLLEDAEIRAPASGTIITRLREVGSIVPQGAAVYNLSLDNPTWIRAYVSEKELGLISPGQKALIYTDSHPKKPYEGQVGFISPQAEFTPKNVETADLRTDLVYRVRINVVKSDDSLRQGMPVSVQILLNKPED